MSDFQTGTRVRVLKSVGPEGIRGRLGVVANCNHPELVNSKHPISVDIDRPYAAPDRDWHFSSDELEIVSE